MNPAAWQYRELVQGLHALQPKKRGNPVSWIVLLGCAYVVGGLGFDHSVREAIFSPAGQHGPQFSAQPSKLPSAVAARVTLPVVAVPAAQTPAQQSITAQLLAPNPVAQPAPVAQPDSPLPHAHAKAAAPITRAHSRKK